MANKLKVGFHVHEGGEEARNGDGLLVSVSLEI